MTRPRFSRISDRPSILMPSGFHLFASHQALMAVHGNANPVDLVEQSNPVLVIGEGQGGVSFMDGTPNPQSSKTMSLCCQNLELKPSILSSVSHSVEFLVVEGRKHTANGIKCGQGKSDKSDRNEKFIHVEFLTI